jgi:hypothetical protein
VAGASSGASCMTPAIPTPCRSPAGRLRRCVPPVPTVRRCPRRSPAPLPPARRGYGYGSGSAVVDGTAGVSVRPCQGSYAPSPRPGRRHGKLGDGTALRRFPARRGYGYGSGSAVVDGTAGVSVRPCQGSYAPSPRPGRRHGKLGDGTALRRFPARRGYGCRMSMPVVDGTGVGRAQACQGSCAPPPAPVAGTTNRVTVRLCAARPVRALFSGKPQPEAQRTAQRRQDRRKAAPSAVPKRSCRFPALASEARS